MPFSRFYASIVYVCAAKDMSFKSKLTLNNGKRSSVTYSIKDSAGNILTDENEILSRWREYFEDHLNPVNASTRDTQKVIHLGEEEVFTAAEVVTAIKGIKSGKAASEDEIRPEMLKALTGEGILWLTRVSQIVWKCGKTPRD